MRRVLACMVTDLALNVVTENVVYGYGGSGDSSAYARLVVNGVAALPVPTFLGGVIYMGTTGSWPIGNAHGDTVGVTDVNATFVANPSTDEYGRGTAPANRLGWLGGHYRFNEGGGLNLTRMGVRLYDPNLGRFLAVDPIEGGSANDYVAGDPVNGYDLSGMYCITGVGHWEKNGKRYSKGGKGRKEVCRSWTDGAKRGAGAVKGGGESVARNASTSWEFTKKVGARVGKCLNGMQNDYSKGGALTGAGASFGHLGVLIMTSAAAPGVEAGLVTAATATGVGVVIIGAGIVGWGIHASCTS